MAHGLEHQPSLADIGFHDERQQQQHQWIEPALGRHTENQHKFENGCPGASPSMKRTGESFKNVLSRALKFYMIAVPDTSARRQ